MSVRSDGRALRRGRVSAGAVLAAGTGAAVLVGLDGAPGWRAVRVLAVLCLTGVVLAGTVHLRAGRRAVLCFAAGLPATAVGAGIAVPYLAKAGWSPAAGAGLGCLGAGIVLLATGSAGCVRAAYRWWRLLVVPALLATAWVVLWALAVAVAATNVPPTQLGSVTPADRGLRYQDVTFTTADGVYLSGWYVPSANGAAVVLLHGAGSTRAAVLEHAVVLAHHGYGVLLYDARGHGRSAGRAMDFGWYGDLDTMAAVSFLGSRPDVHSGRIGAVGMSMGGEEAIGAAAADPRIAAVVAEGATNRITGDKGFLRRAYGVRGMAQQGIDWLTYAATDLLTRAPRPMTLRAAAGAMAPRPLLLITAGGVPDEAHAAAYIREAAPQSVEVWQVPGAGHTGGLRTAPVQWQQRVAGFLDRTLLDAAPGTTN